MSWALATASGAAIPAYVGYRWWQRHQREQAIARELDEANGEPLRLPEHIPPRLASIASQAHQLRIELELPIRRVRAPLWSETPWARRQRCDEYDAALYEIRLSIWAWLRSLQRLDADERRLLAELGLSVQPFRKLLYGCDRTDDVWEQVLWAEAPDLDMMWAELHRTILALKRFEHALASAPTDPYR